MQLTVGSSIICMDHLNFQRHALLAEELGIDFFHVDVMDGIFVPRFGIYPEIVRSIAEVSTLKMDLHLMVSSPEFALTKFEDIPNVEYVSIHLDGYQTNTLRVLDKIRCQERKAVLVVDLTTDLHHVAQYINDGFVDGIMFMGIHPGVLDQKPRPEIVVSKIEALKLRCDLSNLFIQCDGGVNFDSIKSLKTSGINNFVCGSSTLYSGCDFQQPFEKVREKIFNNKQKLNRLLYG